MVVKMPRTPSCVTRAARLACGLKKVSCDVVDWDMMFLLCRVLETDVSLRMEHFSLLDKLILPQQAGTTLDEILGLCRDSRTALEAARQPTRTRNVHLFLPKKLCC